ncbi:MAG: hypothetical protein JO352_13930 [Chloroflexi bacterium]|nr:hypothetical protein [Chloroflexota bacterium]MBV9599874.1 hypothetical protein [Chloroflexota bacterium]
MRWLLAALGLTIGGLALLVWLIPAAPMTGDGQYYIQFVRNGLQHGASSWHERRLLGPLIVRALPMDALDGFFLLTCVSLGVTSLLTWLAARELLPNDEARALTAIPLLFGTWVVAPNLREFGLIDPLAWAFVAAVWLATIRRQWWLAAIVAAAGVVAKEIVVLAAVAAAAAAFESRKPWRAVGVAAPAVLVALALTVFFPGSGNDAAAYVFKWVQDGLFSNGVARAVFLLFASYGALWLLLPRAWPLLPPPLARAGVVYVIAAVALPLVGSPERMEEALFPLVITAALLATRSWSLLLVWALAVGNALFVARVGGDARIPTLLAWAGLALACALALYSYLPAWLPTRRQLAD